jgi:integrase/recombinase XerD
VRVPSRIPKALSEDHVLRLLESISGDDPLSLRDRAVLELLYGTGARVSEIVTLNLSDLSYDDGLLRLIGKGDKERLVPVGRAAHEAVSSWTSPLGRSRLIGEKSLSREDQHALFLNQRAKRITRQGIHLMVQKRAERAGLESAVSPHVLRHSCATHMLAHGADIRVVQELLGHSSVATTQIYTKVSQDHLVLAYTKAHPRAVGPTTT